MELSRLKAKEANVANLVTIEHTDLFNADLRDADVIAVYLLPQQLEKLIPQLGETPHQGICSAPVVEGDRLTWLFSVTVSITTQSLVKGFQSLKTT